MTAEAPGPMRPCKDGIELFVRLTPRASRDELKGVATTGDGLSHIKARVRAVPEKGAANAALEKLLARSLGVPASSVAVISGATSRLKTVRITGDPAALTEAVLATDDAFAKPASSSSRPRERPGPAFGWPEDRLRDRTPGSTP